MGWLDFSGRLIVPHILNWKWRWWAVIGAWAGIGTNTVHCIWIWRLASPESDIVFEPCTLSNFLRKKTWKRSNKESCFTETIRGLITVKIVHLAGSLLQLFVVDNPFNLPGNWLYMYSTLSVCVYVVYLTDLDTVNCWKWPCQVRDRVTNQCWIQQRTCDWYLQEINLWKPLLLLIN